MSIKYAWLLGAGVLAAACGHRVPPESHADIFALGEHNPWSTELVDTYSFPGVRLATLSGAPEVDDVDSALDALTASCEGLNERIMWLECSESPCHVYVWGVKPSYPPVDWAEITCQNAPDMTLHGTYLGELTRGGLQMIAAGIYAVSLDAPPQGKLDEATMSRAMTAGEAVDLHDTVLSEAAALHGY